jgi:hypothetical protein
MSAFGGKADMTFCVADVGFCDAVSVLQLPDTEAAIFQERDQARDKRDVHPRLITPGAVLLRDTHSSYAGM